MRRPGPYHRSCHLATPLILRVIIQLLVDDFRDYFNRLDTDFNAHQEMFGAECVDSVKRQKEIEAADTLTLDEYLARYYA